MRAISGDDVCVLTLDSTAPFQADGGSREAQAKSQLHAGGRISGAAAERAGLASSCSNENELSIPSAYWTDTA